MRTADGRRFVGVPYVGDVPGRHLQNGVCVCVLVRACVRAFVRACVRVRAFVRACVCARARVRAFLCLFWAAASLSLPGRADISGRHQEFGGGVGGRVGLGS